MKVTTSYQILTANGLEEIKPRPALALYSRVHCRLSGDESTHAIISERDANGVQKTVNMGEPIYGNPFNTVDQYSKPISKKFGIGVYWDDLEPDFRFSESEVKAAMQRAKEFELAEHAEKTRQEAANEAERRELPGKFPHLTPIKEGDEKKTAANNLRAHLKHLYPDMSFSVRKENYSSYYIRWNDGPTEEEIRSKVCLLFMDHGSDITGDYWDYMPSNFNKVFGGFRFVTSSRTLTDKTLKDFDPLSRKLFNTHNGLFHSCWNEDEAAAFILHSISLPANFRIEQITEEERNPEGLNAYSIEMKDLIKVIDTAPKKQKTPVIDPANVEGIKVIDYSDKAVAVIGYTKPVKDKLKEMGGRFNFRLACGSGWIFKAEMKNELNRLFS